MTPTHTPFIASANEPVDILALEIAARRMRAEAMAAYVAALGRWIAARLPAAGRRTAHGA